MESKVILFFVLSLVTQLSANPSPADYSNLNSASFFNLTSMSHIVSESCSESWTSFYTSHGVYERGLSPDKCVDGNAGQYCNLLSNLTLPQGSNLREYTYNYGWCYPPACTEPELNLVIDKFFESLNLPVRVNVLRVLECTQILETAKSYPSPRDLLSQNLAHFTRDFQSYTQSINSSESFSPTSQAPGSGLTNSK